jgi:flagellar protein FliJ
MSLDALRKLRAQTVEALMMELAQIAQVLTHHEERYHSIEDHIQMDSASYDRQAAQGLTIEAVVEWQGHMNSQQAVLRQVRREIDQATLAWQRTKALLVEASQERKLLDVVADKRQDAQRAETGRQEQRVTDEAANRRYSSRSENGS